MYLYVCHFSSRAREAAMERANILGKQTKSSALRLVKGSSAEVSAGACFYTSGKAEERLLSQDSFLFGEVFTFEFGLTPHFTPVP